MTDTETRMRLSKRLAEQLPCSRREAELYIEGGMVQVDGATVELPGARVAAHQHVALTPGAQPREIPPVTLLLHKPAGYEAGLGMTSDSDNAHAKNGHPSRTSRSQGVPDALALIAPTAHWQPGAAPPQRVLAAHFRRLQCFTPLPTEASGLVVYTQDARIAHKLAQDIETLEQECLVDVAGDIAADGLQRLCHGLTFNGRALPPIKVSWQSERRLRFALKGIRPGQVAAMCAAVGLQVVHLRRLRIGRIPLAQLPPGQWRYLLPWERF